MKKFLFDLFPVLLFFLVFKLASVWPDAAQALAGDALGPLMFDGRVPAGQAPILLATAVAILASVVQVVWLLARGRRVEPMLWIGLAIVVTFGGATIWLHDETFIKWKPTILYAVFAALLAGGQGLFGRNLLRAVLGAQLSLPEAVWMRLLWLWCGFFVAMAALNIVVAYSVPTTTWVDFKLFGLIGLTLAFSLATGVYMTRHLKEAGHG
jgi:intracellular septation protein